MTWIAVIMQGELPIQALAGEDPEQVAAAGERVAHELNHAQRGEQLAIQSTVLRAQPATSA